MSPLRLPLPRVTNQGSLRRPRLHPARLKAMEPRLLRPWRYPVQPTTCELSLVRLQCRAVQQQGEFAPAHAAGSRLPAANPLSSRWRIGPPWTSRYQ